jgi:transposase
LISDCLSIYDNVNQSQQKCYAHHLKAIREATDKHPKKEKGF